MVAATIFSISAVSSLQVWNGSAAWSQSSQRQQDWLVQIDADLQRSEGRLRRLDADLISPAGCENAIRAMAQAVASPEVALAPEITRRLEILPVSSVLPGQMLVLSYGVNSPSPGSPLIRQRQWSAQAFGLCRQLVSADQP
ncbi:hypothetical protein [Cyanobium sp. WAJ14-Wanaka]|uniref:hypothetical protein n=1 Tax=Cyanobium sp. WAJ14-Wanaka TaxID=2823725 RepID=UPI0020CE4FF2|nr:hypothetical protein [Cyanobium sp. WAJ14-Wanaka]MCP9774055.1 hypothetical protein [Cyanobium sp. WAJ14-Wanaka]